MENTDTKIMENTILKVKKCLDKIPFIEYSELDFCTSNLYSEIPWYKYTEGKYYKLFEERGKVYKDIIASNEDEMVNYFIKEIIFRYACKYELKHRHYFEDPFRMRDIIEEFCYNLINKEKRYYKRDYDDEWAIISDLLNVYRKKCIELKEKYKNDNIDFSDIDYIIKREYADNSGGGMSNPKQGIKKAHEKIELIQKKFPETKEYFRSYEKYYNKINF